MNMHEYVHNEYVHYTDKESETDITWLIHNHFASM